jgi:hypothetical protein
MFRQVRVIIREFFHAYWVTCESNALIDKTALYVVMCLLCGVLITLPSALGKVTGQIGAHPASIENTMYNAESYQPMYSIRM